MKIYKHENKIEKLGTLYLVPTPIGNLLDITQRALIVLKTVDIIAAEDTRHTKILLKKFKIKNNLISFHKFNEKLRTKKIIEYLKNKKNVALVSNAGTPIINDPGFYLISQCIDLYKKINIVPLPGPCAAITALIASGCSTKKFCYEGFIPSKKNTRIKLFNSLKKERRTIIFYESSIRLINSLIDIKNILGKDRYIVISKELTKKWEYIHRGFIEDVIFWIQEDHMRSKGEIVLIIKEKNKKYIKKEKNKKIFKTFKILKKILTEKEASKIAVKIHKTKKNYFYKYLFKKK
ncbi:16S rRNA (cytidine(1402)-2'-O)-methyltransferase [Buchnera aphidicola (Kurisakia onigurumii)]|uniref:16S rRNA (cytidine(1402)-2'-O)-methyltransferase n=1 Tax=Buchnera aphidicola TaxID=9 RepID=UPI0031B6A17B